MATSFDLDGEKFKAEFESEEMKYANKADFQISSEMGVRGFPSVAIRHNGQLFTIANGFTTSEKLIKTIEKMKAE